MEPRIDFAKVNPRVFQLLLAIESYLAGSGLDHSLLYLIKMRASIINGCAYCIDMHSQDAKLHGESEQRLYALAAWRETPFFTDRERAALEWTDAVTQIGAGHAPDEVYERVSRQFDADALVNLTLAINSINSWNRMSIALRVVPGTYKPGMFRRGNETS
jgi:AhpD family alkylhydroperoxidase